MNVANGITHFLHYFKLAPESLIVLYDDIDLPIGSMRIRANGSAGSHNGMRSIIACVHSENFARVRIGVGKDESVLLRDYVLKRPSKAEQKTLDEVFENAADAALEIIANGVPSAANRFNGMK